MAHGHGRLWTPLLFDSKIAILFFIGFTFIYRTMAPIICHCMLRVQICIQSPALLPMVFILKFRLGDKCMEESAPCLFVLWERAQVIRLPCWLNSPHLTVPNFFQNYRIRTQLLIININWIPQYFSWKITSKNKVGVVLGKKVGPGYVKETGLINRLFHILHGGIHSKARRKWWLDRKTLVEIQLNLPRNTTVLGN